MEPLKMDRLKNTYDYIKAYGKKGYKIKCKYVGLTESKRKIYNYSIGGV